jgi:hypothetical protein
MNGGADSGSERAATDRPPEAWARRLRIGAWVIFVAWASVSFLTPAATSDLWTNFKVGEDILAGRGLPVQERYSATAAGRPFVAYEWLSSVAYAAVHRAVGPTGLVLLRLAAGLSCLALLLFALPRATRACLFVLPLLMVAQYLLCFRTQIRPHLFSLVILCALCLALERWRRSRRLREIVWLIPLHCLWANLHGAFLFGIVVLGAASGGVLILALFPRLAGSTGESFVRSDGLQLASVALASLVVSLINPYGVGLWELVLRISESSEYIRDVVFEWKSPLITGSGKPWNVLYWTLLLLVWSSLVLRMRDRPWLDLLLAALVTFQSVRANRFVPYLAIFGFPIVARCAIGLLSREWTQRLLWLRPWLLGSLAIFMLVTSFGPLRGYSPRSVRPLGLGFCPHMPIEEVEYIRDSGLKGVIFNEYFDGGAIIYGLYPSVRPVMDARIDIYGPNLFREWQNARSSPKQFSAYANKYGVELVLIDQQRSKRPIYQYLMKDGNWALNRQFDTRVLFERVPPADRDR